MAVHISDNEVSPLNASLLPSSSPSIRPRHAAGPFLARSPTPALPPACRFVPGRLVARSQPGKQSGSLAARSKQLASSEQSFRPADAVNSSPLDRRKLRRTQAHTHAHTHLLHHETRTLQLQSLTTSVALPTNPNRDANAVRSRRQRHSDRRRRNRPIPGDIAANRRAADRV